MTFKDPIAQSLPFLSANDARCELEPISKSAMSFQISVRTSSLRPLLLGILSILLFLAIDGLFFSAPSLAAQEMAVRYIIFEQSLPIADLHTYAETGKASSALQSFLNYLSKSEQKALYQFLQVKIPLNLAAVDKLLDTEIGKKVLTEAAKVTLRRDRAGIPALRAAAINGAQAPGGLGVVSFLEAYPSKRITIDLGQANDFASVLFPTPEVNQGSHSPRKTTQELPQDNLSSTLFWQLEVKYQMLATADRQYDGCLFGDSISAGVGNTLGDRTFNLALNGLSTISLVEQLKLLNSSNVKCRTAIIAIGTNDAMYGISNQLFLKKMSETIALVKATGTQKIFIIPAFYSTVAASLDPNLAGPIPRVDEINTLINQIARSENLPVEAQSIQPLFKDRALKENLTVDGVHLNDEGLKIYRQALLKIFRAC